MSSQEILDNLPKFKRAKREKEKKEREEQEEKNRKYREKIHPKLVKHGVFDMVNTILSEHTSDVMIYVIQDDLVRQIQEKFPEYKTENQIIDDDLLEFESFYEEKGWKITYYPHHHSGKSKEWVFEKVF